MLSPTVSVKLHPERLKAAKEEATRRGTDLRSVIDETLRDQLPRAEQKGKSDGHRIARSLLALWRGFESIEGRGLQVSDPAAQHVMRAVGAALMNASATKADAEMQEAIVTFLRILAAHDDKDLQAPARIARLVKGTPAVDAIVHPEGGSTLVVETKNK